VLTVCRIQGFAVEALNEQSSELFFAISYNSLASYCFSSWCACALKVVYVDTQQSVRALSVAWYELKNKQRIERKLMQTLITSMLCKDVIFDFLSAAQQQPQLSAA
jgi:hypothetical protein